ncbi:hypothetical protein B0T17DRAFT_617998 [Bombardia bombarda]|uniref:Oxidase ustYa n=1 Tax=Bombardia bombarda TaxID=252184 RepID=A0AA39WTY5_9PEZI|nr:hypothetical protein B0T17DRAFT_617998 [Bombardia bombarda]
MACAVAASLALGYIFGHVNGVKDAIREPYGLPPPTGPIQTAWEHNFTFSQRPTPESEAAWASIIPIGRGFIHHPQLAPFISNIAVFHELHCLHAVVIAYWTALESPALNVTEVPDWETSTATRIAPFHVRHCFDYIRQALMCAADTNLEVVDEETHLTNGWGQPKQCRDYDGILEFAERYRDSNDTGIVTNGTELLSVPS